MTHEQNSAESGWQTCPRCGVHIVEGSVRFAYRPSEPRSYDELSRKVCQWAVAQDRRSGTLSELSTKPSGCINPCYDDKRNYGSPLDDIPDLQ